MTSTDELTLQTITMRLQKSQHHKGQERRRHHVRLLQQGVRALGRGALQPGQDDFAKQVWFDEHVDADEVKQLSAEEKHKIRERVVNEVAAQLVLSERWTWPRPTRR